MPKLQEAACLCGAFVVVSLAAACGEGTYAPTSGASSDQVVADTREVFEFNGLSDWTSYATQVSVVKVEAERELPPEPPGEPEQYVPRMVTLRIERTIWPGGPQSARDSIELLADGWLQASDGSRRELVSGGPRITVGQRLLVPLFLDSDRWGVLTASSVLVLSNGQKAENAVVTQFADTPAAAALSGRSMASLARTLANTPADAEAARHAALPPIERRLAVTGRP